ncbi:MAG TPA: hypothetical protein IGR64_08100 [Leptolyngbyaceae cyanobacterium M65_K2018_010]|nr:hypothetical protein [Leptolyngbyaceae cyanobacterium M65_K2018_010]
MNKLACYACPTGALADQIQDFLDASEKVLGPNAAHAGLPYCTLIDLFEETTSAVPLYAQSLDRAYKLNRRSRPDPVLTLEGFKQSPAHLELALTAPWLRQLMVSFTCTVKSPTRKAPLPLQDHLGIVLANGYPANQAAELLHRAQAMIRLDCPSHWELRLYQRSLDGRWLLHQSWDLGAGQPGPAAAA